VYAHAWEVCTGQAVAEKTRDPLRERDKAVNRGEREIRRLIIEHLTLNPGKDASGCMALMIMAKDVERAGDQCRAIFDVGVETGGKVGDFRIFPRMDPVRQHIGDLLPKLQRAVLDTREELAREILEQYQAIKPDARQLLRDLYGSELSGPEAVASTLLAYFLARINAHIGNAASGIIFPLENIDFVSRGLRQQDTEK
jgi:phosphate uptake regulator